MTKGSNPLVSVLMNGYNGEKYLSESINSVISQTYQNWELVFWDNQSTDNSAEIVKKHNDKRIKYYLSPVHTNLGMGRANAWKYLTGEFIAILDVDDIWMPEKLERQLPLFNDPEVGIAITNSIFFGINKNKVLYKKPPPTGWVFKNLIEHYYISLETVMFRKQFANELALAFDPNFSHISDMDLIIRLSRISKLDYVNDILAKCRIHEDQDSWTHHKRYIDERVRFIQKLGNEIQNFEKEFAKEILYHRRSIIHTKAFYHLLKSKRLRVLQDIIQLKNWNWKSILLILMIILPFPKKIINFITSSKY